MRGRGWLTEYFGPWLVRFAGVEYPVRPTVEFEAGSGVELDVQDVPATTATKLKISLTGEIVEVPDVLSHGDMFFYDSVSDSFPRIPIGTLGQVMTVVTGAGGAQPGWANATGGGPTALDPNLQAWNGSWGPAYTVSPWAGRESPTGASGSPSSTRSATATIDAPNPIAFNGLQVPNFDGINDDLDPSGNLGNYINASTGTCSGHIVFQADTAATDDPTNFYLNEPLLGENGGVWGIGFSTAGLSFFFTSSTGPKRAIIACATGGRRIALFRYDGTNIEVSVDGGATWASTAATWSSGAVSAGSRTVYIGRGNASNFDGPIADIHIKDTALSRAELAQHAAFLKIPYGVTF